MSRRPGPARPGPDGVAFSGHRRTRSHTLPPPPSPPIPKPSASRAAASARRRRRAARERFEPLRASAAGVGVGRGHWLPAPRNPPKLPTAAPPSTPPGHPRPATRASASRRQADRSNGPLSGPDPDEAPRRWAPTRGPRSGGGGGRPDMPYPRMQRARDAPDRACGKLPAT